MKFSTVLPFILITAIWSIYNGQSQGYGLASSIPFALGGVLALVGIPYGIATLAIKSTKVDYLKRRLNLFIIIWGILIFCQVAVHFMDK